MHDTFAPTNVVTGKEKHLQPLYYTQNDVANLRLSQAYDRGVRAASRFFVCALLWILLALALVVIGERRSHAQQAVPPFATNQINTTFYVGQAGYPTIQSAVTKACGTGAGAKVVIAPGMSPADTPAAASGCAAVYIEDQRQASTVTYSWINGAYAGSAITANAVQSATGNAGTALPSINYSNVSKPPLSAWEQCLHNAHDQVCGIVIDGDSRSKVDDAMARVGVTGAISLDIPYGQRWADLLRKDLQARYGSNGTGAQALKFGDGVASLDPDHFTYTGSFTTDATLGPYQVENTSTTPTDAAMLTFASGSVVSFLSPDIEYTRLRVYCASAPSTGSWTLAIDGKAVGSACGPAASYAASAPESASVNRGYHTATLTATGNPAKLAYVEGVNGYSGVAVHNPAVGSASLEWFATAPSTQFAFSDLMPHALTIVHHLTNEPGHNIPTTRFLQSLTNLFTHETGLSSPASVLFLSPTQDGISGQAPYFPVLKTYATSVNAAFLDFRDRYGVGVPAGIFGPDGFHENKRGNAEEAAQIEAMLFDAPLPPPENVDCSSRGPNFMLAGFDARNQAICRAPAVQAPPTGCGQGFGYSAAITIPHANVAEPLTNFPVMLAFNGDSPNSLTYTDLKASASGGKVLTSAANDVIFCSTASGGQQLAHELVGGSYVGTTGAAEFFVRLPTLSPTADTQLWMFYGNNAAANTARPADVWSNGYAAVYHFGAGFYGDSTANGNTLAGVSGGSEAGAVGKFNAYAVLPTTATLLNLAPAGLAANNDGRTVEGWVQLPNQINAVAFLFGYGNYNRESNFGVLTDQTNLLLRIQTPTITPGFTPTNDTAWHFVAIGLPQGSATAASVTATYDGASKPITCSTTAPLLGCGTDYKTEPNLIELNGLDPTAVAGPGLTIAENLDEVRYSSKHRSPGWLSTEYANMSNPATFFTMGSATAQTGPTTGTAAAFVAPLSSTTAAPTGACAPKGTLVGSTDGKLSLCGTDGTYHLVALSN